MDVGVQKGGGGVSYYIFAHADITETRRGGKRSTERGDGANRNRDMHREVERRVQRNAQRWHREKMRQVQKGGDEANRDRDMLRVGEEKGTFFRDIRRDGPERT